ncbi:hypothetical protein PLEOSDRAFT_1090334 [Pleurotus ostreatus PC15]|uniref:Uncharacterized protein n=1 Tax=Pleurotus ostreatus (strain PC15) TaxID=1137138 RepID=A0A067N8Y3_PLEO1|nr:hypothetical protein PLEOSDRAFT_1090334 [Pleurotus ostreatus PC15]
MSSILRSVSRRALTTSRSIRTLPAAARAFHSPFAVLDTSPLTSSPPPASFYQKEGDEAVYDAFSNSKTYVVCQPDPSNTFHEVPSGAYPTSAPYVNWDATEAPDASQSTSYSSTSSTQYAHPITRSALRNPSGVGESAAVRNASAPGSMGMRGGGFGGLALMDKAGTQPGDGELASRNPQPDGKVAEKFSKLGVEGAWKERK